MNLRKVYIDAFTKSYLSGVLFANLDEWFVRLDAAKIWEATWGSC